MLRLRIYKVLLPAALIAFIAIIGWQLRPTGVERSGAGTAGLELGSSGTSITAVDMDGARKTMEIRAAAIQQTDDGRIRLDGIEELKLFREEQPPLTIKALSGDIEGDKGARRMVFGQGVTLEDPDKGLTIHIPDLSIDEQSREARSDREVRIEGDTLGGMAGSLLYRFDDRPAEVTDLDFQDADGARLRARRGIFHDGVDDVELIGDVRVERRTEYLETDQLRVLRRPNDRLEHAVATGSVRGALAVAQGDIWDVTSEALEANFDEQGEPRSLELSGGAYLSRGTDSLSAETIAARRLDRTLPGWRLRCEGGVALDAHFDGEPALLRSTAMTAVYVPLIGLVEAQASGRVSFDGQGTRGDASSATYDGGEGAQVRLFGTARRKARVAHLQTRVAAEEIALAADGSQIFAERGVESSLLPADDVSDEEQIGPFSAGQAIHFVSRTLSGRDSGSLLVFEGEVRGWQGERNLAAERITVDQEQRTLTAEEQVSARMPRVTDSGAPGQSDYVQITSARLEYSELDSEGVFRDDVRIVVVEGWMEAGEVRVRMGEDGNGIAEVIAVNGVRLEFRRPGEDGAPSQMMTGQADRLVYSPTEETIWLIGENAPASVRQVGEGQGTTTGRVLRYQLELGTLEVDSGSGGPATIRTNG